MTSCLLKPQVNPVCRLAKKEGSPVETALGCTGKCREGCRVHSHSLMRGCLSQHLEIFVFFCLFGQQAMFLSFEIPERAGMMETFCPLGTMSVAEPGTPCTRRYSCLSSGSIWRAEEAGPEGEGQRPVKEASCLPYSCGSLGPRKLSSHKHCLPLGQAQKRFPHTNYSSEITVPKCLRGSISSFWSLQSLCLEVTDPSCLFSMRLCLEGRVYLRQRDIDSF